MKSVILLTVILSLQMSAQRLSRESVPAAARTAFAGKYSVAKRIRWEKEKPTGYEAEFRMGGKKMSATFDASGNWQETECDIRRRDLPAAMRERLNKDFKAFRIRGASRIESATHGQCYEAELKKGRQKFEVLAQADGQLILPPADQGQD